MGVLGFACLHSGNMSSLVGVVLLVLAVLTPSQAFVPIGGGTSTHVSITGTALLQKVTETCRAVAEDAGYEFNPTVRSLNYQHHILEKNGNFKNKDYSLVLKNIFITLVFFSVSRLVVGFFLEEFK